MDEAVKFEAVFALGEGICFKRAKFFNKKTTMEERKKKKRAPIGLASIFVAF